jgi:hypothetical protein
MVEFSSSTAPTPPKYGRAAFFNIYNLSLLGGALACAGLTQNWFLGLATAGLELVWMLVGPESHAFRRWVDRQRRAKWDAEAKKRLDQAIDSLPEREKGRVEALQAIREQILQEAKNNPSFAGALLELEFGKLDQLRDGFVGLATACVRAESHLAEIDLKDLGRQMEYQKRITQNTGDAQAKQIALRNIEVLQKRAEAIEDVHHFLTRARGQMTLIENTISLMRDQVITMQSPQQLAEPLDDLLRGVDAVRAAAQESDELLGAASPVTEVTAGEAAPQPRRVGERG